MRTLTNRLASSSFLRHNTVFFAGSILVGGLNYLYYPVLGRMMDPAPFGEVQALVSLFLQLTIFLTVLGMVTVNIAANYRDQSKRNTVIFELERLAFVFSLALLALSVVFAGQFKEFLRFEGTLPFVLLAFTLVVTVPFMVRSSFIRGKKRFGLVSAANMVSAGAKIVFSAALVAAGLGTAGAILGVTLAQAAALALTVFWAARLGLGRQPRGSLFARPDWSILAPELRYAGLVLVCSLIVTALFSVDIVVVKHFFDAHTAGLYAGIATVARIIFFGTASIAQVLMPSIKLTHSPAHNRALLAKSLALLALFGVPCALLFALAPEFTVRLLMGPEYLAYANLLPMLGLVMLLVSVINLLVSYHVSLRRYSFAVVMILGAVVTCAMLVTHHENVRAVVNGLLIGSVSTLVLAALWEAWHLAKGRLATYEARKQDPA